MTLSFNSYLVLETHGFKTELQVLCSNDIVDIQLIHVLSLKRSFADKLITSDTILSELFVIKSNKELKCFNISTNQQQKVNELM